MRTAPHCSAFLSFTVPRSSTKKKASRGTQWQVTVIDLMNCERVENACVVELGVQCVIRALCGACVCMYELQVFMRSGCACFFVCLGSRDDLNSLI
jgi:hypothetical protein